MSTTVSITLVHITCTKCGVVFGLESHFNEGLRGSHATFYCPNGDPRWYPGKSDEEKQRERAEMAERSLTHARERMARVEASRNALKGVVTRTKNRVAAGTCPCCNRTFAALARHMKTKHPGYALESKP